MNNKQQEINNWYRNNLSQLNHINQQEMTWKILKHLYKRYCVVQNALRFDTNVTNYNYDQRKYAIEDVVFALQPKTHDEDSPLNELHYIQEKVNKQKWTEEMNANGSSYFVCVTDPDEEIIH